MVRLSASRPSEPKRLRPVWSALLPVLAAFAALSLPAQTAAPAATQALFLDDSGSMHPYYTSGLVRDITEPLAASINAGSPVQLFAFSTDVFPARSLGAIASAPFGQYTFLDKVIDQCHNRHIDIGWIVTDNIDLLFYEW